MATTPRKRPPARPDSLDSGATVTTRDRMIQLAIDQMVERGPMDFNAADVCEQLGIKRPMINHYFGSREKFVAEAIWRAYRDWARNVDESIRNAPRNPRKRLEAFIEGEIAWARRMGPVHTLINYPMVSSTALRALADEYQEPMRLIFEYHLALLTVIARDIDQKTASDLDFTVDTVPRRSLLANPKYFLTATQISWATHGLASWSSGQHVPTATIEDLPKRSLTSEYAVRQMIKTIIAIAG